MTNEEAIIVISYIDYPDEKVREALDIAKKAIEKQIPKKPVFGKDLYGGHLYCPSCKKVIMGTLLNWQPRYCSCGQHIDWSDER